MGVPAAFAFVQDLHIVDVLQYILGTGLDEFRICLRPRLIGIPQIVCVPPWFK
jgi:hypothetical protein